MLDTVPLSTSAPQAPNVVSLQLVHEDSDEACDLDASIAAFLQGVPAGRDNLQLATDAVVDRQPFERLVKLAACGSKRVLDSMKSGGLLTDGVVALGGRAYDLTSGTNVAVPPARDSVGASAAVATIRKGGLVLLTSGRGRVCRHTPKEVLLNILKGGPMADAASAADLNKRDLCKLLELHLRIKGQLLRPGLAGAT
jgi:hypothetical protein